MKDPNCELSELSPEIKAALTLLVSSCTRAGKQLLTVLSFDDIKESIANSDEEPVSLTLCVCLPRIKALRIYDELTSLVKS